MRKLIVCNIMSVDGFYEGPGNNVMVLPMDGAFDAYNLERIQCADTVLLGRASYELFSGFWPNMADNPEATDVHREFSRYYNNVDKAVITDTYSPAPDSPWYNTTTVVPRSDVEQWVADRKAGSGRDMLIFASHTTWNSLLAAGLVDELHLIVGATALGAGTPTFTTSVSGLRLLDAARLDNSDNCALRYTTADR
jgi:dihydrofolate reductase